MTYARCGHLDVQDGGACNGELEPMDEGGWRCSNCGELDPSIDGSRCDDCGMIEENWGDNLVCPACFAAAAADEPPYAVATRVFDGSIRLVIYDARWGERAVTLEPKRALLLGADLIRLAAEGELTMEKARLTLWGEDRWGKGTKLA
jgi:hypothetical protein